MITIRPATLADLNACLQLDHSCITDHVWQMKVDESENGIGVAFDKVRLPRRMRAEYPRNLEQLLEDWNRDEGFLAAEVAGSMAGYIDLAAQPWQQQGRIINMAVDREQRRQGIGTALVRHANQWARQQGLRTLFSETTTKNYPAIAFFQKMGFQFCGYNDHYYINQDIALFFAKTVR